MIIDLSLNNVNLSPFLSPDGRLITKAHWHHYQSP